MTVSVMDSFNQSTSFSERELGLDRRETG